MPLSLTTINYKTFLINKNIIDFKSFFIFCFVCTYFVSLDLIYQLNFGKDIFGYISTDPRRLSGPFENESIAGSYLQRFSLFALITLSVVLIFGETIQLKPLNYFRSLISNNF